MNFGKLALNFFVLLLLAASQAAQAAYLPYLEEDNVKIAVSNPEISQAHYGWLAGAPAIYAISSAKPFRLHLNLMSPQLSDARVDFSAKIYRNGQLLEIMNGVDFIWSAYYEPFAGDYYLRGPEYEINAAPGNYLIEIYNSVNYGDYVLVIGKNQDRSLGEFLRTMSVLPDIKEKFFGKTLGSLQRFRRNDCFGFGGGIAGRGFPGRDGRLPPPFEKRLDKENDDYQKNRGNRGENYIDLSEVQRLFDRRP